MGNACGWEGTSKWSISVFGRNMNKQRQSNFELLRIVSMILIVLHHLGYYAPATADDPIKTGVLLLLAWGGSSV